MNTWFFSDRWKKTESHTHTLIVYGSAWGCFSCLHSSNRDNTPQRYFHSFSFPKIGNMITYRVQSFRKALTFLCKTHLYLRAKKRLSFSVTHLKELEGRMPFDLTMTQLPQERRLKILSLQKMSSYSYFRVVPQRHTLLIKTLLKFSH